MTRETNASAGHDSTQAGRNVLRFEGLVMHPFLSRLIFSRRLRGIVKQLVDNNDFRQDGVLYVLKKWFILIIGFIVAQLIVFITLDGVAKFTISVLIITLLAFSVRYFRHHIYVLPTLGVFMRAKVKELYFGSLGIGWNCVYQYSLGNGSFYLGSSYISFLYLFKDMPIKEGGVIFVMVNPEDHNESLFSLNDELYQSCISKSKYDEIRQLTMFGG